MFGFLVFFSFVSRPDEASTAEMSHSAVTFNYRYMRCAQFGLWQGTRRAHTPQWVCNRRATQPQAKFGATRRAAVLFRPDFVARSSQIHLRDMLVARASSGRKIPC